MNPGEKQGLKAQLTAISAVIGGSSGQILAGATMPIATPMGPAAAPGLVQMGQALTLQANQLQELIKAINKIVDDL